ncbi:folate receptor gamma-like isoform X2 [Dreissena polymorpha]|uniref:folate receptor gamma-like isoform X2 n=1 Tax=Dreissena polymorpha TaxID=45954 RepID=UPI0022650BBF|nr:folate receptor gamma-like isoform X2 [Dreissena polymorpha]
MMVHAKDDIRTRLPFRTRRMLSFCFILVLVVMLGTSYGNRLAGLSTLDDYMNICMDGIIHKDKPTPEAELFQKCTPWKDRSCCTKEITESLHINATWYNFNWNHCPQPLSPKCKGRFQQDLCFYECSPNVGPWLVKVDGMKIRKERFVDVPLCQSECDAWWEDCRDDFTCTDNWSRNFNWTTGTSQCPTGSYCLTFNEMFKNSTNFCEKVWDHSWKVVNNTDPDGCFVMWWQQDAENPNYQVAKDRALKLLQASSSLTVNVSNCFFVFVAILVVVIR